MTAQQLKNSILQMAVQGKLVPQDYNEKPIDLSGIKKKTTEEYEFDLPEGWLTGHLECITTTIPSKSYQILESQVLKDGMYPVISQSKDYSIGFSNDETKLFQHDKPVVIFGDHTTVIKLVDFNFIVGADGVKIFSPHEGIIIPEFLFYVLQYFTTGLNKVGGYSRHYKFIKNKAIPLPPLSEQHRIVAKIEELLPYIEKYGAAETKLFELNTTFPEALKKSILQEAVQGKLVPQNPDDEPASVLLERIRAEKQALIKAGKIKKEKPLAPITEDEIPFEIPDSWMWVRMQDVVILNPKNTLDDNIETGFIPMQCVQDGFRNNHIFEVRKWGEIKKGFTHFANGDIGVAKITPCFQNRKSVVFRDLPNGYGAGTTELTVSRIIGDTLCHEYLLWFFKTDYFISNGVKSFTGTAGQQRIHKDYLGNCLFPLPPLAEQKRIAATIEEVLPIISTI